MSLSTDLIYTPDDLLTMPEGDRYELIDGRLVERNMGGWSVHVGTRLLILIGSFDPKQKIGWLLTTDASYQCFPKNRVRRPDLSFICLGRLPEERVPDGHIRIAPDLAVEVISPNDLDYETDRKVEDYLQAGTRLVWVVNPEVRTVLVYRGDGSIAGTREPGELDGEDVIPGFRCRVFDLFVTPKAS